MCDQTVSQCQLYYDLYCCSDEADAVQPINSLPGVSRYGVNKLVDALRPLVQNGLSSVSTDDAG